MSYPEPEIALNASFDLCDKLLKSLVPGERFELPTNGLQNRCSTTELTRLIKDLALPYTPIGTPLAPENVFTLFAGC
jgi:hypothetical protein